MLHNVPKKLKWTPPKLMQTMISQMQHVALVWSFVRVYHM